MQNVKSPRQNIQSLISSIRAIAKDVSREVGSNPQDPSFSIQPTQSQPNNSYNMQSSVVQSHQKPTSANRQTLSPSPTPNTNVPKQEGEKGTLLQEIQKAHAKVDEVIRTVPREVHDQVLSGQIRSLTNVPNVSSFQNLQVRENAPGSLQDIASSYRMTTVPSSSHPAYMHQSNPFVRNSALGEFTVTTSTPYLVPPTSNYGQRMSANRPGQPINTQQFTNYNLYQSISLNEIPNQPETTEENRPKSLLYASNYFNKSASKTDVNQTPLQEKYKQFFPRQYPPTSSHQKDKVSSLAQSQVDQSENIRRSQALSQQETPENQNQHVEKILEKLRYQEERQKRQRLEEDAYDENQTFGQSGYGKAESVRRGSKRRGSRDSRKHLDLQDDITGSLILPNNVSEHSVGANSRQDIERRIEKLGKESRKTGPKKVIPSLGGGQLVIEKKESNDLERNTQIFGKEETSSGANMSKHGVRKRADSSARDRNPNEFKVKNTGSRRRRDDDEFDFDEDDGDYEQYYYYGEDPRRMRQPKQEEQDFGDVYSRSGKGNRSRSRINNGEMVWSSHKKSKQVLKSIKF